MNAMCIKIRLNPSKDSLKKFNSPVTEKPSAAENPRLPLNEFLFTVQGSGDFQSSLARLFRAHFQISRHAGGEKGTGNEIFARRNTEALPGAKALMKRCG